MTPGEQINFDFSPDLPEQSPEAIGGRQAGAEAAGDTAERVDATHERDAGEKAAEGQAADIAGHDTPGAAVPVPVPQAKSLPAAKAARVRAPAVARSRKASPRQRLLYGILAALLAVIAAIGIVALFRMTDPAMLH